MKAQEISDFCMQMSLLLGAAISLDNGLAIMSENAANDKEKETLISMSEEVEMGATLAAAMEKKNVFPKYVIKMVEVGQETGTLEATLYSLARYYEREHILAKTIKSAITYPMIMICMLLIILFVLLTKVMPVFEGVYEQLGTQVSPTTQMAIKVGSYITGAMLAVAAILFVFATTNWIMAKQNKKIVWAERLLYRFKEKSRMSAIVAKRRFLAILAVTVKSGLEIDKGVALSLELIEHKKIVEGIYKCKKALANQKSLYEAIKEANLFTGTDLQMLKVGTRSGQLDIILDRLADKYEEEVNSTVDNAISRFEPTVVIVLAIAVGLILLSVMMPLISIMAAIG